MSTYPSLPVREMELLKAELLQQRSDFPTRIGFIWIGVQNDFLSPDGKLPVKSGHEQVKRITELVPVFRKYGDVIWVRSVFETNREVTSGHDEAGGSVTAGHPLDFAASNNASNDKDDDVRPVVSKKTATSREKPGVRLSASEKRPEVDEKLHPISSNERDAYCVSGSHGAEYPIQILDTIDFKDLQVKKIWCSAFRGTTLRQDLQLKRITNCTLAGV